MEMSRVRCAIVTGAMCLALASAAQAAGMDLLGVTQTQAATAPGVAPKLDEKSVLLQLRAASGHPDAWRGHFAGELREVALSQLKIVFRGPNAVAVEGLLITTIREAVTAPGGRAHRIRRSRWGVAFTVIESETVPFKVDRTDITTRQDLDEVVIPDR